VNGVSREDLPTSFLIEILEEKRKEKKEKNKGSSWDYNSWIGAGLDNKFQNSTVGGAGRSLSSDHHQLLSYIPVLTYGAWTLDAHL
jgi:hypothetical protein